MLPPPTPTLPLTTLFVPPNSCFTDVYWYLLTPGQTPQPAGTTSSLGNFLYFGLSGPPNCLPTSWAPSSYYSPGFCPSGYEIACSSINTAGTVTETVATCCPSNYACGDLGLTRDWYSTQSCTSTWTYSHIHSALISVGGSTTLSGIQVPSGWGVNAYSVQVRWQSTDTEVLGVLTPTLSVSTSSDTLLSSPGSRSTASSRSFFTAPPTPTPEPSLSTGAQIAIGVIIPIISLAILLGLFILWRRRQSATRKQTLNTVANPSTQSPWWKPELDAEGTARNHAEARSQFATHVSELDAGMWAPELSGDSAR